MDPILAHMAYKLLNAPILLFPFPHIYIEEVFPPIFYEHMLVNLPKDGDYSEGTTHLHGRRFGEPDNPLFSRFLTDEWLSIASAPFKRFIAARFKDGPSGVHTDLRLIRDRENYQIGPHTDAPWKILSYLFYLPVNDALSAHGTSIYLPNDPAFRCPGGPHHPHDKFTRIYTAPFRPNTLFAFFKTDFSFHGVEPITIPCQRDLLLWNLYDSSGRK